MPRTLSGWVVFSGNRSDGRDETTCILDGRHSAHDHCYSGTRVAAMQSGPGERYDFFLSRRGSVAPIAREVTDILATTGYKLFVQDYDIPLGASFLEAIREAIKNCRNLIILYTQDYLSSPYTREEFASFEAERVQSPEQRHIFVLRCEDVPRWGCWPIAPFKTL